MLLGIRRIECEGALKRWAMSSEANGGRGKEQIALFKTMVVAALHDIHDITPKMLPMKLGQDLALTILQANCDTYKLNLATSST